MAIYVIIFLHRELVNIVKHLEKYGTDGLLKTLENVFAFDIYDSQLRKHLKATFHKHGIPLDTNEFTIELSEVESLGELKITDRWTTGQTGARND